MLGWVLRRGLEGAPGGNRANADDTTQIEQPDTPAPVFAARALKNAIFGTPARPGDDNTANMAHRRDADDSDAESRTPLKPQGILLTPGTGTSRRKRVSFGHDVLDNKKFDKKGKGKESDERLGKFPESFTDSGSDSASKRTKLTEAMENSRRNKGTANLRERSQTRANGTRADDAEDEWEEADDDQYTQDVTIDLNEPHSRSGKYWKSEFEQYHQDAKAEMEKLLKYKQLAKSYAKMKDAEAIDLNAKLKEEQEKVAQMEMRISEMAAQIASKRASGEERDNPQLMKDLAKQTAVAVEYKTQVKELEALLGNRDGDEDEGDARSRRRRQAASPRTHKALLETQRELRKARAQIKENGQLREEVERLKSDLLFAEQRANKLAEENKRLAEQQPSLNKETTSSRKEVEELKEATRQKDEELRKLKSDFEAYRTDAEATQEDTRHILEKATDKINELKREIKTLKAGSGEASKSRAAATSLADREHVAREHRAQDNDRLAVTSKAQKPSVDTNRRSLDLVESLGKKLNATRSQNIRDKYQRDDESLSSEEEELVKEPPRRPQSEIFSNRVDLDKPKWRPFIPRSPRNREYLGADLNERIVTSTEIPSGTTPAPRHRFASKDNNAPIDLLQDRFARLGGPDMDASNMAANMSKSTLPPERRAAAIARIERRKADKKRAASGQGNNNKENMRPQR
ncbi:spindle pole body formation-associated protein-domain-containing protein [Colletotrichum navitas]|uniref:Spindle pole body formation-associated protein-domain-containing protein n=1 Tax=Colletotrichum navitas TaxID=681940 RepID=A0AAD8VC74_9PEZI|nr:spindle pole body formation-associated protein-domain-containing protein [Colletotrichum navitas]KAK1599766.1 spindle pole body formation-associated protein-domain-containing protein [Colletotrichum navitas]